MIMVLEHSLSLLTQYILILKQQCIICLDDYTDDDKIRILRCRHHFHVSCSDEWLFLNNKCPLCYQNIVSAQDMHNNNAIDDNIVHVESVVSNDAQEE